MTINEQILENTLAGRKPLAPTDGGIAKLVVKPLNWVDRLMTNAIITVVALFWLVQVPQIRAMFGF